MDAAQSIIILGNSGFARECHIMLRHVMERQPNLSFRGFLSFEGYPGDLKELSPLLLGDDDKYVFSSDEAVIVAIGDPGLRKKAFEKVKARGGFFFTLVHPQSFIDSSVIIGDANIIGYNCHISCNCTIGDANVCNGLIHIGHDTTIGNYNFIAPNVQILGGVRIGSQNSIGATSVILPHAVIGNNNSIAPLSAVFKGCKDNCYLQGNPAIRFGSKSPHP